MRINIFLPLILSISSVAWAGGLPDDVTLEITATTSASNNLMDDKLTTFNTLIKKKGENTKLNRSENELSKVIKAKSGSDDISVVNDYILSIGKTHKGILIGIAMIESADWTSEKHIKANNPYGLRCTETECNISDSDEELTHFNTITEATQAMIDHINHSEYLHKYRAFRYENSRRKVMTTPLIMSSYMGSLRDEEQKYKTKLRQVIYIKKLNKLTY